MRGAAFLSGLTDAVVIDVGGTTTDVGLLVGRFPRQAGLTAEIGGVETNYTIPDTVSIGLGGGSIIRGGDGSAAGVTVGPDSVGHRLPSEALCFGGGTATATDIACVQGAMEHADASMRAISSGQGGDAARAAIPAEVAGEAWDTMQRTVEELIDKAKISSADVPVILVGGGAILVGGSLRGVSKLERPRQGGAANAIGAAIAQTSGTVDRVFDFAEGGGRDRAFAAAEEEAVAIAVAAGAHAESITVVEREEIPLAYMPGESARLRVKVVGDLDLAAIAEPDGPAAEPVDGGVLLPLGAESSAAAFQTPAPIVTGTDNPVVDPETGDWVLRPDDVDAMVSAAAPFVSSSRE